MQSYNDKNNHQQAAAGGIKVPAEILRHVAWLEQIAAQTLAESKIATVELAAIKKQLDHFLEEYYSEIAPYVSNLRQLNQRTAGQPVPTPRRAPPSRHSGEEAEILRSERTLQRYVQRAVSNEVKTVYRSLVKHCHPDTTSHPQATEMFSQARKAYEAQDLPQLVLLEHLVFDGRDFPNEHPVQKLERWEKKYHMALQDKERVMDERKALEASSEYALWQRVLREREQGFDLVREIKENVMQELHAREAAVEAIRRNLPKQPSVI